MSPPGVVGKVGSARAGPRFITARVMASQSLRKRLSSAGLELTHWMTRVSHHSKLPKRPINKRLRSFCATDRRGLEKKRWRQINDRRNISVRAIEHRADFGKRSRPEKSGGLLSRHAGDEIPIRSRRPGFLRLRGHPADARASGQAGVRSSEFDHLLPSSGHSALV